MSLKTLGLHIRRQPSHWLTHVQLIALVASLSVSAVAQSDMVREGGAERLRVVADGIPEPLSGERGNAERGRTLLLAHDAANCVLCHALPDPGVRFAGNVGPSLDGVGRKFSIAQLRLRVADNLRLNPTTIMPSYHRIDGLDRVASAYRGKPILTAGEVEDIVAYLGTLQ